MVLLVMALAWRNLWRQKRRTTITVTAVAVGLGGMVFMVNLMMGMRNRLTTIATESIHGDAQLHSLDYRQTGDPDLFFADGDALLQRVAAQDKVREAAPRLYAPVLAAMGDRAATLTLCGVDPAREQNVTNWRKQLWQGAWFELPNQVLIGRKLADSLEVEVGGKLVLTAADLRSGELNSQLVYVGGVLWSQNPSLNEHMVIAPMPLAQQLVGLQGTFHEIALKLDAPLDDRAALEAVLADFAGPDLEAVPWQTLMPGLLQGMKLQRLFMGITFSILFLLAALGIANTMGMSLLERSRELGMMQAIGTSPAVVGCMVVLEYSCLGLLGVGLGFVLGQALTLYFMQVGIPVVNVEVIGMVLNEAIHPGFDWAATIKYLVIFCLLVPFLSWGSIRWLQRRDPVEALRFE